MSDKDYLKSLTEAQVAAFYRRLADFIEKQIGHESLAAMLLRHWLDGKGKTKIYPAKYVRNLDWVRSYLRTTARLIFLSKLHTPNGGIGGVVPRINGTIKTDTPGGPYSMHLEGNVEAPLTVQAKAAVGMQVDANELDVLYALHGFTVASDVVVAATLDPKDKKAYQVKFQSWTCTALDEYHWNPDKHLAVPNPDFGSKESYAVAPDQKTITIYHSNAIRIEKAKLAQAFHNESEPWKEDTDLSVIGPDTVRV